MIVDNGDLSFHEQARPISKPPEKLAEKYELLWKNETTWNNWFIFKNIFWRNLAHDSTYFNSV